jgi:hypothetical protein
VLSFKNFSNNFLNANRELSFTHFFDLHFKVYFAFMSFQFHGWSQKTTFLSEGLAVQIDIHDLNIVTNERIF